MFGDQEFFPKWQQISALGNVNKIMNYFTLKHEKILLIKFSER